MNLPLPILVILSLLLPAQAQERPSIAVNDLQPQGVESSEANVISDQLRSELMSSGTVRLIERNQMDVILKEQGFQQAGCINDACAVEIGQLLGVRYMVVGSLGRAGSYTILTVRVLNVATAEVLASEQVRSKGDIDRMIESGVREMASRVLPVFDAKPPSRPGPTPPPAVAAPQPAPRKRHPGRTVLFATIGAVVVGGGVGAAILLRNDDGSPEQPPTPNVRITLP